MDKNTIIGLVLIVAVLIGFSFWNSGQKPPRKQEVAQQEQRQPEQPAEPAQEKVLTDSLFAINAANDSTATAPDTAAIVLSNDNLEIHISPKGGMVSRVYLKNYRSYTDFRNDEEKPLLLYSTEGQDAALNLGLSTKQGTINTLDCVFTKVAVSDTKATLRVIAADSSALAITYSLMPGDNYMLNMSIAAEGGLARHLPAGRQNLAINWYQNIRQHEKGFYFENQYSALTYKLSDGDTEKLSDTSNDQELAEGPVDWVAFKNQYFSSVMLCPNGALDNALLTSLQHRELTKAERDNGQQQYLKRYEAAMTIPFDATGQKATTLQFYYGPNQFNLLKSMDKCSLSDKEYDLETLVYLGWPIIRWINRFFTIYVFDFLTRLGLPMGIVLLLITILMRIIVYAPTRKSFMSTAKMRVLKPKVDEISRKYPNKEDAMKKQQEMMTLYSQYGVSPMGGCLPMLIQMPIWIAMFNFVPNAIELRQQGFLWAEDLSTYDSLIDFGTEIWGIGDHLSLFCLLFSVTQLVYSYMTMRQQRESMSGEQAQQMKVMQWMMYLMPILFFFMLNKYSSGLNYYYFIPLLASILTMWYLRRRTDDAALLAKLEANYKANQNDPNKKPRGLAARLEALNKQAAMMDAQRKRQNNK